MNIYSFHYRSFQILIGFYGLSPGSISKYNKTGALWRNIYTFKLELKTKMDP